MEGLDYIILAIVVVIVGIALYLVFGGGSFDAFKAEPPAPVLTIVLPPLSCMADATYPRTLLASLKSKYPHLIVHITEAAQLTSIRNVCRVSAHLYIFGMSKAGMDVSNSFVPGSGTSEIDAAMNLRKLMMTKPVMTAEYPSPGVYSKCPITWQTSYERTLQKAQEMLQSAGIMFSPKYGTHDECAIHYTFYPHGMHGKAYVVPITVQHAADLMTWIKQFWPLIQQTPIGNASRSVSAPSPDGSVLAVTWTVGTSPAIMSELSSKMKNAVGVTLVQKVGPLPSSALYPFGLKLRDAFVPISQDMLLSPHIAVTISYISDTLMWHADRPIAIMQIGSGCDKDKGAEMTKKSELYSSVIGKAGVPLFKIDNKACMMNVVLYPQGSKHHSISIPSDLSREALTEWLSLYTRKRNVLNSIPR